MNPLARTLILFLGALGAASPAHVVFDKDEGKAGGYFAGALRVSHGCGASPTRSVRVEIPAVVLSARPQPKAGWTVTIEKEPLKEAVSGEGGTKITERVRAIIWTGELPADQFDQFGIMMKLPAAAADPLYFPTRQTCETGENAWVNIPADPAKWHDTPNPAPMLRLTQADHDHAM